MEISKNKELDKNSKTETSGGSIKQKLIEHPLTYTEVEEKVRRLLPNSFWEAQRFLKSRIYEGLNG